MAFKIRITHEVVNEDGVAVDWRGFVPRNPTQAWKSTSLSKEFPEIIKACDTADTVTNGINVLMDLIKK